ncbi:MAG: mono/diheme cytochrome c family protein, partial [Verrucomicrobiales bacterium]
EGLKLYADEIKPLFQKHCFECHGAKKTKGGLDLTRRVNLMHGGDSGVAIVVGDRSASLLFKSVTHAVEQKMPHKKDKLADAEIDTIGRWIDAGADYAAEDIGTEADLVAAAARPMVIGAKDRAFWSFGPLLPGTPPPVKEGAWSRTPIDRFLSAALQAAGLEPSAPADRRTLIRRASFTVLGLPPAQAEVEAFVADQDPKAYEHLIDRLLGSEHYGERWARHWLDVARFAESHGYEADNDRPNAYSYRDAVIRAFNRDLPYHQFIQWQLAGDEYAPDDQLAKTLTGFIAAGPTITDEGGERVKWEKLDDIVSATGEAMLALSIGCAKCHDHKYDPIRARDYYGMAGIFANHKVHDIPLAAPQGGTGMVVTDHNRNRPQAQFLERGDWRHKSPTDYQFLEVLMPSADSTKQWLKDPPDGSNTSYSRRAMAEWMTDTQDGAGRLLARVIVNRLWQHHFGTGIVKTASNFGSQGAAPTHPELLDWLASELIENGWSLKHTHKQILMSAAYRQSTTSDQAKLAKDPTNQFLSYRRPLRLEAEAVRDAILAASGVLNRKMYGPSVKPWIHNDAIATGSTKKWPENVKDGPDTWRRSIYIYTKRSMLMPMLEAFDLPDSTRSCAVRNATVIAPAALLMLNNEFIRDQAKHLAARVAQESGTDPAAQVQKLYAVALARTATLDEIALGIEFMASQAEVYAGGPDKAIAHGHRTDALVNYCQAVLALNEFLYVD